MLFTTIIGLSFGFIHPSVLAAQKCEDTATPYPPFYITEVTQQRDESFQINGEKTKVSDNQKNISVEKFTPMIANNRSTKIVPRGTVVTLIDEHLSEDVSKGPGFEAAVQVVSTHQTYHHAKSADDRDRMTRLGEKGYLWSKSLKKVDDLSIFIVTRPTYLLTGTGDSGQLFSAGTALSPWVEKKSDGTIEYHVKKCCSGEDTNCSLTYIFESRETTLVPSEKTKILIDPKTCYPLRYTDTENFNLLQKVHRVVSNLYQKDLPLHQSKFNDFGYIRLHVEPYAPGPKDQHIVGKGPNGYYVHYQEFENVEHSDLFAKPHTACALYDALKDWKTKCHEILPPSESTDRRCTPQIGDMAFVTPGRTRNGLDPLKHATHYSGECVDVRPFRTDDLWRETWAQRPSKKQIQEQEDYYAQYDRALTEAFIEFLKKRGAGPFFFNDDVLSKKLSFLYHVPGHHNHIHVCFGKKSPLVRDSCLKGV